MILYLGLDPSRWKAEKPLIHYPVIRTKRLGFTKPTDLLQATHLIFTSRSAVSYWEEFEGKEILAIGEATAEMLQQRGLKPLIAPDATQEGMAALLDTLDLKDAYLIWPRSNKARHFLTAYLKQKSPRKFLPIDLYETIYQHLKPEPSLENVEEIVFTSPSTVEGFLRIYRELPQNIKLTPIGPITRKYLLDFFRNLHPLPAPAPLPVPAPSPSQCVL